MGIKQLYNDNLRKLPNEYGDVSVMRLEKTQLSNFNGTDYRVTELYSSSEQNAAFFMH